MNFVRALVLMAAFVPFAARAFEFTVLSEAELYTLNTERQIFPTNQRTDHGQRDLNNPTDYPTVVWAVVDPEAADCKKTDTAARCKGTAIYIVVSTEEKKPVRFGIRTEKGFDWRVIAIQKAPAAPDSDCVHFSLQEELREGGYPAAGWPTRSTSVCLVPDGFAEVK